MAMILLKCSRGVAKRMCVTYPRYKSDSSGDKGENGGINKYEKDLTDLIIPICCASDNPSEPTMYDCRKYGHNLPCHSVVPNFDTLPYIPSGIFRCTYGEVLGRGANKCGCYQNPEYFSYHHMTFYDMHLILCPCRQPAPITGRKP